MVKKIAIGLLAAVALAIVVVLGIAATKPDTIHVERSRVVQATPAAVAPFASDYTRFTTWIPWTALDPDQHVEFSDPPAGVGAWYTWSGDENVGSGRMELLSLSESPTEFEAVHQLEFIEPWPSVARSTLRAEALDDARIELTWSLDQDADFGTKVMLVFLDMDAMIGADFEAGLDELAQLVETKS
ncbi:SRPBCC family protein [Pseudenhygromyxa sp. WMMC2535]|uniref:SRPBCC family protein n=1 Tax=Pseudenhygromyxa sp. WMMC2535 TaxID=2712867 RepID=UPI001558183B|nr:SRPBCC family protein [Pseudenhygromyxa sp. WMMC2535]NVB40861.1 SRPBCC family protein [Pseudenhygromyxa sp. WMMC2535]